MPQRLAGTLAILAFAICLVIGGVVADNPLTTTIARALVAMIATLVVGLIVGYAAQKMIDERMAEVKSASDKISEAETPAGDR
jgi:tetrahydromethanopterin S-methyltransferase subunit C